jgi:hypothetical protein
MSQKVRPNRLILSSYSARLPAVHGLTCVGIDIGWLNSGVKAGATHRLVLPVSDLLTTISNPALEMSTVDSEIPQFFRAELYQNNSTTPLAGIFEINLYFTYLE